jgi:DNA-binding PadR family transcriptional regulator
MDKIDTEARALDKALALSREKALVKEQGKAAAAVKPLTESNTLTILQNDMPVDITVDDYMKIPLGQRPQIYQKPTKGSETYEEWLKKQQQLQNFKKELKGGDKEPLAKAEKDVNPIRQQYLRQSQNTIEIQSALGSLNKLVREPQTGARDIGIVFRWMKTFDPGSVVREGEQATAANAGSVPENIRNFYNQVLGKKQKIDQTVINDMLAAANANYAGALESQKQIDNYFKEITDRSGLPPVTMKFVSPKELGNKTVNNILEEVKTSGQIIEQDGKFFKYDKNLKKMIEVP